MCKGTDIGNDDSGYNGDWIKLHKRCWRKRRSAFMSGDKSTYRVNAKG